jgi:hypothetical protein
VGVERDTAFQLEEESGRIARIVAEAAEVLPLPETIKQRITARWLESSNLLDMDEEMNGQCVRDLVGDTEEVREAA